MTVTKTVSSKKTTESTKGRKKKKDRIKGRNEKKAIGTLQSVTTEQSNTTTTTAGVTGRVTVDVHHSSSTDGDHASLTSVTSSQDTSQLLDDVETSQSQIELLNKQKPHHQITTVELPTSSSSLGSRTRQDSEKNYWHVTMESTSSQAVTSSNEVTVEVSAHKEEMADNKKPTVGTNKVTMETNEVAMEVAVKEEAVPKEEVSIHNEVTMEEAIKQLTSSSQQAGQLNSHDVSQPTSVTVELTSVQQLQQPTVVSVDVQPVTDHTSTLVQRLHNRDHVTNSDRLTTSNTQQESLNDQMTSHQGTMKKAITQVTSQQETTVTKGSESANQMTIVAKGSESANQTSAALPIAGVDDTIEAVTSELDFDFPDINFDDLLSGLRELGGEDDMTQQPQEPGTKKSLAHNQSAKKTEYHTMSLFSNVPITAPPPKAEQVVSKGNSGSFQRTVPVSKANEQYRSMNTSSNVESTLVMRSSKQDDVARQQSLAATVPVTKESMKSVTMTTNKPVEISVTKKPTTTVTSTKESVTMTTTMKPTAIEGSRQQQKVPLAMSHKKEMQQQKDGTDIEWNVDMEDIDVDLASQLEELNSIIGQLGGMYCTVCSVCM